MSDTPPFSLDLCAHACSENIARIDWMLGPCQESHLQTSLNAQYTHARTHAHAHAHIIMEHIAEQIQAAAGDPELMQSVSAQVGDGVGLLFTESGAEVPQDAFERLVADFSASGQKMIGLPASMITRNASVREARVSLEKQTGVYLPDESDPLDVAEVRKFSLANQIHLMRLLCFVRANPPGTTWIDYIAQPIIRTRLDEIAAELGIHATSDNAAQKARHLLCLMVHKRMEEEEANPLMERVEAQLARYEKIEAQVNRLIYAFVQEKIRRERQQTSVVEPSGASDEPAQGASATLVAQVEDNAKGSDFSSSQISTGVQQLEKEIKLEDKRKKKNAKRRQLAREAAFRKAIERGDIPKPKVPAVNQDELEKEAFMSREEHEKSMLAQFNALELNKVRDMVFDPDLLFGDGDKVENEEAKEQ